MEFSNKTLAWLVVATIVVSLCGTMISLNKLNTSGFTGFASSNKTGNASVTISSQTTLNFAVNALNFGTGTVNATAPYACNLSNNGTTTITKTGNCDGFNSSTGTNGWLQIENIGNTLMNVSLNFSKNATNFIGGGTLTNAPQPIFMFTATNNETGSCANLNTTTSQSWVNIAEGTTYQICNGATGLQATPTANSMAIGIFIGIPYDASGSKTVIIQASGSN